MFTKCCSSLILIVFSLITFQSCIAKEKETRNVYFIDNQSSIDLRYKIEIDDTVTDVKIPSGDIDQIYSEVVLGGSFPPNTYFESISGYIESDIFLTRDSSEIEIEAFKLNAEEDLDWIERESNDEAHFTLTITDDMIN